MVLGNSKWLVQGLHKQEAWVPSRPFTLSRSEPLHPVPSSGQLARWDADKNPEPYLLQPLQHTLPHLLLPDGQSESQKVYGTASESRELREPFPPPQKANQTHARMPV